MLNQLTLINIVSGAFAFGPVLALIMARRRLGTLNAASWLVVWGSVIVAGEHGQFAISYSVPFISGEGAMVLLPHARIHFFMAGIYTLLGVVMLGVIARTLLREGRPVGWNAIRLTLFIGGSFDLVVGGLWFQHGSPLYQLFGVAPIQGFGWTGLYGYMAAWSAALMLSYGPVFRKAPTSRTTAESGSVQ